ncbi:MAG: hypothetical protein IPG57_05570 [Burkholderiales bacterium]|nr:hypothetical protein [Burkholderiales bacterium]MBP6251013.1 hypothetical protein [Leptothrix sp. (in: b-proteobacteria)]
MTKMDWNPLPMAVARKENPMPRLPDLRFVRLLAHRIHQAMARPAAPGLLPAAAAVHPLRSAHAVATCGLSAPRAVGSLMPKAAPGNSRPLTAGAGARLRVDPSDRQRALISGTMHEVCDALDSLIEEEARARRAH